MWKLCLLLTLYFCQSQCWIKTRDEGHHKHFILYPTKDVWLEGNRRRDPNGLRQLIVGHLRHFPLKRSLIQFESLPRSNCPADKVIWARMQLYYHAAHRWSARPVSTQPWIDYTMNIHRVRRYWVENQATAVYRYNNAKWAGSYLKLGVDAEAQPECKPTVIHSREPRGLKGFDVTGAFKAWQQGSPNYGLLIKVVREHILARGLRFWDRHHPNKQFRPFLQVLCRN